MTPSSLSVVAKGSHSGHRGVSRRIGARHAARRHVLGPGVAVPVALLETNLEGSVCQPAGARRPRRGLGLGGAGRHCRRALDGDLAGRNTSQRDCRRTAPRRWRGTSTTIDAALACLRKKKLNRDVHLVLPGASGMLSTPTRSSPVGRRRWRPTAGTGRMNAKGNTLATSSMPDTAPDPTPERHGQPTALPSAARSAGSTPPRTPSAACG